MRIDEYISSLRKNNNIIINVSNDELKIKAQKKDLTHSILEDIRNRKSEIIDFFSSIHTSGSIYSIQRVKQK
jgi:hypothetical protein